MTISFNTIPSNTLVPLFYAEMDNQAANTEDLGKVTFRPSITAYVVGDDCFDQRDRLIDALNKPGPGTLVHATGKWPGVEWLDIGAHRCRY